MAEWCLRSCCEFLLGEREKELLYSQSGHRVASYWRVLLRVAWLCSLYVYDPFNKDYIMDVIVPPGRTMMQTSRFH